jgi:hypothetical protein
MGMPNRADDCRHAPRAAERARLGVAPLLGLTLAAFASAEHAGPPEGSRPVAGPEEIVLSFRGQVDGSERIEITPTHAYWRHGDGSGPDAPAWLNGIRWEPKARRVLDNEGETRFLSHAVDLRSARLRKVRCRDTVALDARPDSLVISINDTPNGTDLYEFEVVFRPRPRPASLRVVAEIDGSDQLHLDATGARWVHGQWECPAEVRLNHVRWSPHDPPFLRNQGEHRFLEGPVDFASAKLTVHEGRDTAVLEHTAGGLVVHFADNPLDRATYDVTIVFGD